jgi:hypothetical protein
LAIRDYIQKQGIVSIAQLSREFHIAIEALGPMLELWVNKGFVRKTDPKDSCGSACRGCSPQNIQYYEWNSAQ